MERALSETRCRATSDVVACLSKAEVIANMLHANGFSVANSRATAVDWNRSSEMPGASDFGRYHVDPRRASGLFGRREASRGTGLWVKSSKHQMNPTRRRTSCVQLYLGHLETTVGQLLSLQESSRFSSFNGGADVRRLR